MTDLHLLFENMVALSQDKFFTHCPEHSRKVPAHPPTVGALNP